MLSGDPPEGARTLHVVSLGCPKNQVDSEVMLGVAAQAGYHHCTDPAEADVIVVNTCAFITPAKREAVDTILEMAEHRQHGRCECLVVAGCLPQRYGAELTTELPEVDHFLGSSDALELAEVLASTAARSCISDPTSWLMTAQDPRVLARAVPDPRFAGRSAPASAYVKIAEGCDRTCAFCVIPSLRGRHRSRPAGDIEAEVQRLASAGVKEINLVSQDTSAYGRDSGRAGGAARAEGLAELVARLADVAGVRWVRLLYLYPDAMAEALVRLLAEHERVLPYVDMPLQHAADAMLRRMRRGHGGPRVRELVERLRSRIPNLTFRTAFIVGHPGETADEFDELCQFVQWGEFEHVGVFPYSDEEGTRSYDLADKISPLVAADRARRLMAIARRLSRRHNEALLGRKLRVLVEGASVEHEHVQVGRHAGQAPAVDGLVYLSGTERLARVPASGDMLDVTISQAEDYDLVGEVPSG